MDKSRRATNSQIIMKTVQLKKVARPVRYSNHYKEIKRKTF